MSNSLVAIILAAGKGTRFKSETVNKVVLPLGGKPMIIYGVELLEKLKIRHIIVVIGFAKESVKEVLVGHDVLFVQQEKQLGPGDALKSGLAVLPDGVEHILVVNGDDSAFYNDTIIQRLMENHFSQEKPSVTFLTLSLDNPFGLGRVVRDSNGAVTKIVEEKDATAEERKIQEINSGCYIFGKHFLDTYLPKLTPSKVTGEYYLTDLIELAVRHGETVRTVTADNMSWRGVNTQDELLEAEVLFRNIKKVA